MKIYVVGSSTFMHEMVAIKNELNLCGHIGGIGEDYEKLVRGEMDDSERHATGEGAAIKRERDYLRYHYAKILEHDAILVVNSTKNGKENYVGANVLIEMGQAYVNNKKIYFLYDMPSRQDFPDCMDEIEAMSPICLMGNLANIRV